jgi:hypothetical protein
VKVIRSAAGGIALTIFALSVVGTLIVAAAGTYFAIVELINGRIVDGIFTFLATAPAMAVTQTALVIPAIPFYALADAGS